MWSVKSGKWSYPMPICFSQIKLFPNALELLFYLSNIEFYLNLTQKISHTLYYDRKV